MKELELINQGYHLHHTSLSRGYISRKNKSGIIEEYDGRFGKGYTIKKPNYQSTKYIFVEYWIK